MWRQSCATVCLEVFRKWIHDQTVSGRVSKPGFTCLNFNMLCPLKLQGTRPKAATYHVSQGALLEVGERPAATAGPGEQDSVLADADTDTRR